MDQPKKHGAVRIGEVEMAFLLLMKNIFSFFSDGLDPEIDLTNPHWLIFEMGECHSPLQNRSKIADRREKVMNGEHYFIEVYIYRFFVLSMVRIARLRTSPSEHICSPLSDNLIEKRCYEG